MFPLKTNNTTKIENRLLSFNKSHHMQFAKLHTHPTPTPPPPSTPTPNKAPAKDLFDFQSKQNGLNDSNGNENTCIICTMLKYGETFYGRHTALITSCNELK